MKKSKNKISLTLNLTFSEDAKISKKDKKEIVANVMDALRRQIDNGNGLAPEDPEKGDYITEEIDIQLTEDKVKLKFNLGEAKFIFD